MKKPPWNQVSYGYVPQPIRSDGAGATDPGPVILCEILKTLTCSLHLSRIPVWFQI